MQQDPTEKIYSLKNSFTIIGLTGRTGAGVSSVAETLSNDFSEIEDVQPLKSEPLNNKMRRYNISYNYAKANWKKYKTISYKNVILIHILRSPNDDLFQFLKENKYKENKIEEFKKLYEKYQILIKKMNLIPNINQNLKSKKHLKKLAELFFHSDFENLSSEFNEILKDNSFIKRIDFFSQIANNIRKSGKCFGDLKENGVHIYSIAETINRIIKGYKKEDTHVVIDSLRNSLEIMFFKERYSAFYMMSINSAHRRNFLTAKYYDPDLVTNILKIDDKEFRGKGVSEGKFYLQDVQNCIQKSDIHLNN